MLRSNNVKVEHIAYKGEAPIVADLLSNNVQWYFATPAQTVGHYQNKTLRPLGVTGPNRLALLPDVPTLAEAGASTFNTVGWYGMFLPAKTPKAIADRLSKEVLAVLQEPAFRKFLEEMLFVPRNVGADEFAVEIKNITEVWGRLIKENDIKME